MKGDLFLAWCSSGDGSTLDEYVAHHRGEVREARRSARQVELEEKRQRYIADQQQGRMFAIADEQVRLAEQQMARLSEMMRNAPLGAGIFAINRSSVGDDFYAANRLGVPIPVPTRSSIPGIAGFINGIIGAGAKVL